MTILFDHPEPALLVHGGMLTQIAQTKAALEALGCQVDYLRWWDQTQCADILHYFGRMPPHLLRFAQAKGIKVVLAELLMVQGARPGWQLCLQRHIGRLLRAALPVNVRAAFRWESHRLADALIALPAYIIWNERRQKASEIKRALISGSEGDVESRTGAVEFGAPG